MKRSSTVTHGDLAPWIPARAERAPRPSEVERLAQLAIEGDREDAWNFVAHAMNDGVTAESALVQLVAPAARLLGSQWDDESREFAEVVKGLDVLRQLIAIVKLTPTKR